MNVPEGFSPVEGLPFQIGSGRSQFSHSALSLKLFGNGPAKKLWGIAHFKEDFMGPPGHAHGGAQAYVLDEVMGTTCWNSNFPVVARSIQIEFKKVVPLHIDLVVKAEITRQEGSDLLVTSVLLSEKKGTLAQGRGRFHLIKYEQFSHVLETAAVDLKRWFPKLKQS